MFLGIRAVHRLRAKVDQQRAVMRRYYTTNQALWEKYEKVAGQADKLKVENEDLRSRLRSEQDAEVRKLLGMTADQLEQENLSEEETHERSEP